jgi:hypothetical protein
MWALTWESVLVSGLRCRLLLTRFARDSPAFVGPRWDHVWRFPFGGPSSYEGPRPREGQPARPSAGCCSVQVGSGALRPVMYVRVAALVQHA